MMMVKSILLLNVIEISKNTGIEKVTVQKTVEALQEAVAAQGFDVLIGGELYSDSLGTPGTEAETFIGTVTTAGATTTNQEIEDYIKENKSLKRKLKVMDQTLLQFGTIKTNYDNLIKKLEEKDSYLKELNLKLEDLVKERTNELENINNKLQMNLKMTLMVMIKVMKFYKKLLKKYPMN